MSAGAQTGILLYDGDCALCIRSVHFLMRRDPQGRLHYVALGTAAAARLLAAHGLPPDWRASVVLLETGRAFLGSTALLRSLRHLRWPWPLGAALLAIPRQLRDGAYDCVAAHRDKWLGSCGECVDAHVEARIFPHNRLS